MGRGLPKRRSAIEDRVRERISRWLALLPGLRALSALARDESGEEEMSYLLIFALVVLPMVVAGRLLWAALLHHFTVGAFIIDAPLF